MSAGYEWTREALDTLVDGLRGGMIDRLLAPERCATAFEIPCRPPFRRSGQSVIVSLEVIRASGFRGRSRGLPGGDRAVVFARGRRSRRAALRELFPMRSRAVVDAIRSEYRMVRLRDLEPVSIAMVVHISYGLEVVPERAGSMAVVENVKGRA